jgi:hypothetical protein
MRSRSEYSNNNSKFIFQQRVIYLVYNISVTGDEEFTRNFKDADPGKNNKNCSSDYNPKETILFSMN